MGVGSQKIIMHRSSTLAVNITTIIRNIHQFDVLLDFNTILRVSN